MKLPRFSLRTLFVLVAIASVPMAWSAYQLNWIRQRHEFLHRIGGQGLGGISEIYFPKCPWSLSMFGERPQDVIWVYESQEAEAVALFPEAHVKAVKYAPVIVSPAKNLSH